LTNSEGEFIASGPCQINRERAEVTMWPAFEAHMLERERGPLTLALEDGRTIQLSDRHLTMKLRSDGEQRISVYRLRILERVPEHLAAGYVPPAEVDEELMQRVREDEVKRMRLSLVSSEDDKGAQR
jgi:hypothetical protein